MFPLLLLPFLPALGILAILGVVTVAIILFVPIQVTVNLEVEKEVLANFRIRWLFAGRDWHRRWPLPDWLGGKAPAGAGGPGAGGRATGGPGAGGRATAGPEPGGTAARPRTGQILQALWPRLRRRLRWRRLAVQVVLGPAGRPDLAAIGCGGAWGVVAPLLAWLGAPREVIRVGIRPALGQEVSRGRLYCDARLRTLDGLLLGWQAYRLSRLR